MKTTVKLIAFDGSVVAEKNAVFKRTPTGYTNSKTITFGILEQTVTAFQVVLLKANGVKSIVNGCLQRPIIVNSNLINGVIPAEHITMTTQCLKNKQITNQSKKDDLIQDIIKWQNSDEPDTLDEADNKISTAFEILSQCLLLLTGKQNGT